MSAKDLRAAGNDSEERVLNMGSGGVDIYHKVNGIARRDAKLCLQEYSPRFNWTKSKARVLDIGSCDGSVTEILSKFLPIDYEVLVGADINPKTVEFANDHYGNNRIKFVQLDIVGPLPDDLKERFDHVFSFYTFHWVKDHQKAFTNIYNILESGGEFFAEFVLFCDVHFIFEILSKSKKWAPWMPNFGKFPSPYYDFEDPDLHVTKMLQNIGFNVLDVRCKQRLHHYESIDLMKGVVTAINPFNIPQDMWPEFMEEFIEIQKNMHLVTEKGVKTHYNLMGRESIPRFQRQGINYHVSIRRTISAAIQRLLEFCHFNPLLHVIGQGSHAVINYATKTDNAVTRTVGKYIRPGYWEMKLRRWKTSVDAFP